MSNDPGFEFTITRRNGDTFTVLLSECDRHLTDARWYAHPVSHTTYVIGRWDNHTTYLHRVVLGLTRGDGLVADHINGNGLDNRRENLRVVTVAQNQQNNSGNRNTSSRYRGVNWDKSRGLWAVRCTVGGKTHCLGRFSDEDEAGQVAAEFRRRHIPWSRI